jgi:hypothetical protein
MNELEKRVSPKIKRSDQILADSNEFKLDELVKLLKSIDKKLELITRAVREINLKVRGY